MKRVIFLAIIIGSLFIIKHLVESIYTLWGKKDLIVQTQVELGKEKKTNDELKRKLAQSKNSLYLEQQARNKLFLIKPGEQEVVIPSSLLQASVSATAVPTPVPYRQWLKLFNLP